MNTLHKIAIPSTLLIVLSLGARPARGGSAAGEAVPASAAAPAVAAGAVRPAANVAAAASTATLRPSAQQSLARLQDVLTGGSKAAPILVIPAQEMVPEMHDRIVEDLSIMSRIIEKTVRAESEGAYGSTVTSSLYTKSNDMYGQTWFLPSTGAGPQILRPSGGRAKAIYVGDYGVLFSLHVSFPLVPPPEAPKPEKATEQTDEVWSAAQRELTDPDGAARARRARPAGEPYTAEAVEDFQKTLTATLKHASNIRDLGPDSWLMVLVQGPTARPEQTQDSARKQTPNPTTPGTGGTLLTLRAQKADIDQFAKGRLDETQFRQRLQIVTR